MSELGLMRVLFAAAVLSVVGIVTPGVAYGEPPDQPAVDQYADPFGPLPTRDQPREFDPLSGDFAAPPAPLLRQLRSVDDADRGPLVALVTQVTAARRSVREAAVQVDSQPSGESDSHVLDGPAASLFDVDGPGVWLLAAAAALAAVAAWRARAIHRRSSHRSIRSP